MNPLCVVCCKEVDTSLPHLKIHSVSTFVYFHADPDGEYCYPNRELAAMHKAMRYQRPIQPCPSND